jgi:hypothetical protein
MEEYKWISILTGEMKSYIAKVSADVNLDSNVDILRCKKLYAIILMKSDSTNGNPESHIIDMSEGMMSGDNEIKLSFKADRWVICSDIDVNNREFKIFLEKIESSN